MASFAVHMMAFGAAGEVRIVDVPPHDMPKKMEPGKCGPGYEQQLLGSIFKYGQNDFQPKQHPSVSVGDVIVLDRKLHVVMSFGFALITEANFLDYQRVRAEGGSKAEFLSHIQ